MAVTYLRDVLATRAASDPQVPAFLSVWVNEELWHGEAFSEFLRASRSHGAESSRRLDPDAVRPRRVHRLREELGVGHQLHLLPTMIGSMAATSSVST